MKNENMEIKEDSLERLPPSEKRKYGQKKVYEYIKEKPMDGTTISEMSRELSFSRKPIEKYVEGLRAQRKIYGVQKGNEVIYKPNGISNHALLEGGVNTEGKKYTFKLLEKISSNEVFIQEKEEDENGVLSDVGGITVPVREVPKIIAALEKIMSEVQEDEITEV